MASKRKTGGIVSIVVAIVQGLHVVITYGGDVDFIVTRNEDPGWLKDLGIALFVDPPFLVVIATLAVGVGLLLWAHYGALKTVDPEAADVAAAAAPPPEPTPTGPRPVRTALEDSPVRLLIANEGERGIFTAQCTIVRGNTGERDVSIPVEWELRDKDGSTEIACGQDNWLRIQRAQIQREIPFRGQVEIASGGMVESSTGGKVPLPESPWIELEVNISADGRQLIERFLWCSCCGFRALGSIMP